MAKVHCPLTYLGDFDAAYVELVQVAVERGLVIPPLLDGDAKALLHRLVAAYAVQASQYCTNIIYILSQCDQDREYWKLTKSAQNQNEYRCTEAGRQGSCRLYARQWSRIRSSDRG